MPSIFSIRPNEDCADILVGHQAERVVDRVARPDGVDVGFATQHIWYGG